MLTRRTTLAAGLIALAPAAVAAERPADSIAELERRSGGRIGVAALDTGSGRRLLHRADERFAMCSTFKVLAVAGVLTRVDRGRERLDRRIVFNASDLVTYSPETEKHAGGEGMTLDAICEAALTLSDNTAGNLLLTALGGPDGLTAYARTLGDRVTRLDRMETELNEARAGDPRDTTTPAAMLADLRRLLLGRALSPASRNRLTAWMVANRTGDTRLRAGLPKDWRVADKTGAGANGATNDVGLAWPPGRAPIIFSVYTAESSLDMAGRNAVIAEVARAVAAGL